MVTLPELEILQSVVGAIPVQVVHSLGGQKRTTERFRHHEPVFQDVPVRVRVRVSGFAQTPVAGRVLAASLPAAPGSGCTTGDSLTVPLNESHRVADVLPPAGARELGKGDRSTAPALTDSCPRDNCGRGLGPATPLSGDPMSGDHSGRVVPVPRKWLNHAIAPALASVLTLGIHHS